MGRPRAERDVLKGAALGLVAGGGTLGAATRYEVARVLPGHGGWPWSTFTVNLAGAFVLGVLLETLSRLGPDEGWAQRARLFLGTGFCGALTTYSTLAVDVSLLVRAHRPGLAAGYAVVSVLAGLALTALGIALAGLGARRGAELPLDPDVAGPAGRGVS